MTFHKPTMLASLKASSPVFFGYISIGFAYGFILVKAGFPWYYALIMCIVIFAGAAQFMAISLLLSDKSPLEIGLAVFLVNARHMVYGLSLLERFKGFKKLKKYLIYGLTDETYALLTTLETPKGSSPEVFDFWITAFNQSYWTMGSLLGALLGTIVSFNAPGLDFALTALFIVLTIEQIKAIKKVGPFLLPIIIILGLQITGFTNDILIISIVLSSIGCFFIGGKK
ncbi:MAG: AzlC family ABC transporter permease [Spirochaetaceae bacterium]